MPAKAATSLPPLPALVVRELLCALYNDVRRAWRQKISDNVFRCHVTRCAMQHALPWTPACCVLAFCDSLAAAQDLGFVFGIHASEVTIAALDRLSQFRGLTQLAVEVQPSGWR